MSERPFMQLYVSDFIGDTLHLSTEQIGAYMLLLMAMWNADGSLPDEDTKLARVVRMSVKKWRSISGDLLPFFVKADGKISHNRLTKELQKSASKSQSRAAAGAKGGEAKALKDKERHVANASVLPQHLPDTRDHIEKPPGFSGRAGARKPNGFVPIRKSTDAARSLIQELQQHEQFREDRSNQGIDQAVRQFPAISHV
ncbi:DUF1376 domain-containing protein [Phyllobacterium sp. 0TCS1.6C]|uniref:YdaU family protein n=1 Tax=unclassified Phyllobacterium TaxID=2638441 RepID=UPI002264C064|nr:MULTISPECIES: DUF1376 domain-containing protein [unclassified Phyllobacterium]MCX8282459.1 DUF1376 domain-containing protein [Phyllobacterium sp. 0TCS1.6C]MCX8292551.1 DUF1376 domain-containing protein [Phyllobacterium sp. 0TCS1.6A]